MNKTFLFIVIAAFAAASDILSKNYIEAHFGINSSVAIIGDYLRFSPVHNTGSVFGGFQGNARFFHILQGIGILALFFYFIKFEEKNNYTVPAFAMIVGGALGNFSDKFFRPGVLDFIDMGIGNLRWFVYNVADIFIFFAIVILVLYYLTKDVGKNTGGKKEI